MFLSYDEATDCECVCVGGGKTDLLIYSEATQFCVKTACRTAVSRFFTQNPATLFLFTPAFNIICHDDKRRSSVSLYER